jgi:penicillin-binding protein-related factor A (putative recombinase)
MPAKPESKFWKQLKDGTADLDVLWTRIESWASPGVPDLFGVYKGQSFWLELKISKLKTVKHIGLSPQQILWQTLHCEAGANVWNLVKQTESGEVKLFHGTRAIDIGGKMKKREELIADWSSESKVDWKKMMDHIVKGLTTTDDD